MPKIINAFTGQVTEDIVGTIAEKKYFRVMGGEDSDRVSPKKKFYTNRVEYILDTLFAKFKGNIEHHENSIRANIGIIENNWDKIHRLNKGQSLAFILDAISTTPVVSFGLIDEPQFINSDGWTRVK